MLVLLRVVVQLFQSVVNPGLNSQRVVRLLFARLTRNLKRLGVEDEGVVLGHCI